VSWLRRNFLQRGPLNKYAAASAKAKAAPKLAQTASSFCCWFTAFLPMYSLFEKPAASGSYWLLYLFGSDGWKWPETVMCFHRTSPQRVPPIVCGNQNDRPDLQSHRNLLDPFNASEPRKFLREVPAGLSQRFFLAAVSAIRTSDATCTPARRYRSSTDSIGWPAVSAANSQPPRAENAEASALASPNRDRPLSLPAFRLELLSLIRVEGPILI
jgi:hypothetical protein